MQSIVLFDGLPVGPHYIPNHTLMKKPLKLDWTKSPITQAEAIKHLEAGGNVGLLLGGDFTAIDCDSPKLEALVLKHMPEAKETYCQLSAKRKGKHFIFSGSVPFLTGRTDLSINGEHLGEIMTGSCQIMLHPYNYSLTAKDVKECGGAVGEVRKSEIINNTPPLMINRPNLLSLLLEIKPDFLNKTIERSKDKRSHEVDNIPITSVISTSGMNKDSRGQYFGSNPWHGSTSGQNFYINPSKNLAYCFRCNTAISPAKAIALNAGIIRSCNDELRGGDFLKVLEKTQPPTTLNDNIPPPTQLKFWTLQDYEDYQPPEGYIVENMLYPQEIGMRYGKSGGYKSLFMLYLAVCIASGRKVFNKFKVKQCPVAILSAENHKRSDKKRIQSIIRGLGIRKKNIPLYILPREQCGDLLNGQFKQKICDFIKEKDIKILFLDSINPLTPDIDDNTQREVERVFKEFLRVVVDIYGCAVEFLHHTDKQERNFLGSIKWKGETDSVFRIEREDLETTFKIFHEKHREEESPVYEVAVLRDKTANKTNFVLIGESAPAIFHKKRKSRFATQPLIDKIKELKVQNRRRKDIEIALHEAKFDYSTSTLTRALKEFKQQEPAP